MTATIGTGLKETVKFGKGMANQEYRNEVKETLKNDLNNFKGQVQNNIVHF